MPLIELDYVISFSSQDDRFPVHNMLKSNFLTNSPWLNSQKDQTRILKADFQLKKASVITHIDIGNRGSAIVEVFVGRSCGQCDEYVTLLPAVVFMSFSQSLPMKYANGCSSVRMFTKGDFTEEAREEKWDRIRIVCRQPFRNDVQFGLDFIILKGSGDELTMESTPIITKEFREQISSSSTSEQSPVRDSIPESRSRTMLMMSRHRNSEVSRSDKKRSSSRRNSSDGTSDELENTRKHLKSCAKQLSDRFIDVTDSEVVPKVDTHECPICSGHFSLESIQDHVESCLIEKENSDVVYLAQSNDSSVECPLCGLHFETTEIEAHASNCSLD